MSKPIVFNYQRYEELKEENAHLREKIANLEIRCRIAEHRPERTCPTCKRNSDHSCRTDEDRTRCPIEEHYALPKDGYCHLYEEI